MAEATQIIYTFKEMAGLLIKDRDIHEGFWGIYIKFGIKAANLGETELEVHPTALVPVLELGLQKFPELNNLSVDAAKVNPSIRRRAGGVRATKKTPRKASKKK